VNAAADGSTIKFPDLAAATTEWQLQYTDLSDAERDALEAFFAEAEGTLNGFTFLDPTANLLAWSTNLTENVWELDPFLSASSAGPGPWGGAWDLANSGAAPQSLAQTLASPGDYLYCLSAYVWAPVETTIAMSIGGFRQDRVAVPEWRRITLSSAGDAGSGLVRFRLEVPAGGRVSVCGLQVEPQAAASTYKPSAESGVYEGARFRDDELAFQATGPNRHSCTVTIIHVEHL
jgi:hypothetical protein